MIPAVRAFEACRLVEDGTAGAELLAEPSAADGSVHPESLLARLASWPGAAVFRYDLEVAVLRLPPVADRLGRSGGQVPTAQPLDRLRRFVFGVVADDGVHPVRPAADAGYVTCRYTVSVTWADLWSRPSAELVIQGMRLGQAAGNS